MKKFNILAILILLFSQANISSANHENRNNNRNYAIGSSKILSGLALGIWSAYAYALSSKHSNDCKVPSATINFGIGGAQSSGIFFSLLTAAGLIWSGINSFKRTRNN